MEETKKEKTGLIEKVFPAGTSVPKRKLIEALFRGTWWGALMCFAVAALGAIFGLEQLVIVGMSAQLLLMSWSLGLIATMMYPHATA